MFDEISSPFADYAIDAIQCHDFCWLLNEVFTAPQILKVMFDAENKLLWLQRDFGVFMVNLFDIQVALALLEKALEEFLRPEGEFSAAGIQVTLRDNG